ncbi:HD-GYP domain-containing protein [Ideonella livida]|uniref:Phosphohydrolase n=1 Tax=Ideonella livida TaxID=2707176 RepID=A0A7C9PIQ3_9BURK|nr:HD domain-containing phosphohydrolase [Ideonella livida]NDY93017.1 phosphohydrolase [Ideonella livida]
MTTPAIPQAGSSPVLAPPLQRWQAWQALGHDLESLLLQPRAQPDFLSRIQALARTLDRLMVEDDNLGVFEAIRISPDKLARYGVLHSLHTAVVAWLVASRKEWSVERRRVLVQAALTMNIAVTSLQTTLALQPGGMQPGQQAQMRQHPLEGMRLLQSLGVGDEEWLDAVAQHHEQPKGKGYPMGLETCSEMADVLRTCDVFCAKMSPRAGRVALLSPTAAAAIFRHRSANYFGATVVTTLGLYPPGSLVALGSGEQAMVLRRTPNPHGPLVAMLTDPSGQPLPAPQPAVAGTARVAKVRGPGQDAGLAGLFPPEVVLAASA